MEKSGQRASPFPSKIRAFAPATVANVGVGFDILGFALEGVGEFATVEKINSISDKKSGSRQSPQVIIEPISGYPELPTDPLKNTAGAGLIQLIAEKQLDFGFRLRLEKQIPVGSGLGGSSTSAVAALVAANAFLDKKLTYDELFHYALIGEAVASGSRHADNIGPCIVGGLLYVRCQPKLIYTSIQTPKELQVVILLPKLSIKTKEARSLLQTQVPLTTVVEQTGNLAGFILGCMKKDFSLIRESLRDVMIEPQRSSLIPGFAEIQKSAVAAGALGCSISGSGPAIFAWAESSKAAENISKKMLAQANQSGLAIQGSWVSPISSRGAHLVKGEKS